MPLITYREATTDDAPALHALLVEIMQNHDVHAPAPDKMAAVVDTALAAADHTFLVAVEGEQIVGMCALIFSLSTWSAAPVCELQDVIVTASARRTQESHPRHRAFLAPGRPDQPRPRKNGRYQQ